MKPCEYALLHRLSNLTRPYSGAKTKVFKLNVLATNTNMFIYPLLPPLHPLALSFFPLSSMVKI